MPVMPYSEVSGCTHSSYSRFWSLPATCTLDTQTKLHFPPKCYQDDANNLGLTEVHSIENHLESFLPQLIRRLQIQQLIQVVREVVHVLFCASEWLVQSVFCVEVRLEEAGAHHVT